MRPNPFIDVQESDWFYSDVLYAAENGLFNGTSGTTFSPHTPATRAMLAIVVPCVLLITKLKNTI